MKNIFMKIVIASLLCSLCLSTVGCSKQQNEDNTPLPSATPGPTQGQEDTETAEQEQRWNFEDFTHYYEDEKLFVPTTDDYLIMESYDQRFDLAPDWQYMSPEKSLPVRLTILRSFDENGNVVSQITRYSFLESCQEGLWTDGELQEIYLRDTDNAQVIFGTACYRTLEGGNYPSLVQVDNVVYAQLQSDRLAEQRTKEQFAADYEADGTKHWFSKPSEN